MLSPAKPNNGKHIDDIIDRTSCDTHNATTGTACFYIRFDGGKGDNGPAICGTRIRKAGFNGKIHPNSLSRSGSKSELRTRK